MTVAKLTTLKDHVLGIYLTLLIFARFLEAYGIKVLLVGHQHCHLVELIGYSNESVAMDL